MNATLDVLLVEDNEADVLLVEEALMDFTPKVRVHVARDGEEALAFLRGARSVSPRFVLLDANTPRKGALEVLTEVRGDPRWVALPVVVYSSSSNPRDALLAYQAGANAYISKPVSLDAFLELVQSSVRFWLSTVPAHDLSDTGKG